MNDRSCRDRLELALDRIADPKGEGARTCLTIYQDRSARGGRCCRCALRVGSRSARSTASSLRIKDLFDVAGEVTRAGSKILAEEAAPATADAPVVQRLRAAGAVIVAKTNMTEFAFSGIGANPHFGTPGIRATARACPAARRPAPPRRRRRHVRHRHRHRHRRLGTHSGGVMRPRRLQAEPATRPDRRRVSAELDARFDRPDRPTVADCAKADAVMAGEEFSAARAARSPAWLRRRRGAPLDPSTTRSPRRSLRLARLERPACACPTKPCLCSTIWLP